MFLPVSRATNLPPKIETGSAGPAQLSPNFTYCYGDQFYQTMTFFFPLRFLGMSYFRIVFVYRMKKHKKDHKKAKTEENTGYLLKHCSGENTFKPRVKFKMH